MNLGNAKRYPSRKYINDSASDDSDTVSIVSDSRSERSLDIYRKSRIYNKQFWTTASITQLSDLIGVSFRHGRPCSVAQIAKLLHREYMFCGFVAPLRAFIFCASFYPLNRQLLSDLAASSLTLEKVIRNEGLLEVLLIMLNDTTATHEYEPIISWAENHFIHGKNGNAEKIDPLLSIFHGYIAVYRFRELVKFKNRIESAFSEQERVFHAITLNNLQTKIRESFKSTFCVSNVVCDVFLDVARAYESHDEDFSFLNTLKECVHRNSAHLSGYLSYYKILQLRTDSKSTLRRLATMRKILRSSPANLVVLDYSNTILSLGAVADLQDLATRLTLYLDHWERKSCIRGWLLLISTILYSKKFAKSIEVLENREFWWDYHFHCHREFKLIDFVKASFIYSMEGRNHEFVQRALIFESQLPAAIDYMEDSSKFDHEKLFDIFDAPLP